MSRVVERVLTNRSTVAAACAVTAAIGLSFVFLWAPHPWGWEGFDHYHELALTVARGDPFPTMEVPWGYAYFLAAFYRLAGDRPWVPLVAQVALNAAVPWLVYLCAGAWFDRRTAVAAALLAGLFSFNTVYASTQSSDAVCTVIFMAALVAFTRALQRQSRAWFAAAGVLTGLAPQFRPNLILIPGLLAVWTIVDSRCRRAIENAAVLLLCALAALTPWVVRNYRLTHDVLPTSVHGGVQLWYGTLQTGPYLTSRAYNPRAIFEGPVFDYTSLARVPIAVSANARSCFGDSALDVALVYWTDRDPQHRRLAFVSKAVRVFRFEVPAIQEAAVLYYYFDATWPADDGTVRQTTPVAGESTPLVYFVSDDHLGDLDVHGDLVDVFDIVRILRRDAWGEQLPFANRLDAAGIHDMASAVAALTRALDSDRRGAPVEHVDPARASVVLVDGSSIAVPRTWSGRITDVAFDGPLALALMHATVPVAALEWERRHGPASREALCAQIGDVQLNAEFYRREPHLMRRYTALAIDNIRREPLAFARATAYRALRVFVIAGSDDRQTTQQFSRSTVIYVAGTIVTVASLLLFCVGAAAAWRRGDPVLFPLLIVAYVPLTIAPVLTNMRYSVTVQPVEFMFMAAGLTFLAGRAGLLGPPRARRGREETRITPAP